MDQGELTPDAFVALYPPDTPVVVGIPPGREMTLGQALQMEAMFCTGDADRRQDPAVRLTYLAGMLAAAGSLHPDHESYLELGE